IIFATPELSACGNRGTASGDVESRGAARTGPGDPAAAAGAGRPVGRGRDPHRAASPGRVDSINAKGVPCSRLTLALPPLRRGAIVEARKGGCHHAHSSESPG